MARFCLTTAGAIVLLAMPLTAIAATAKECGGFIGKRCESRVVLRLASWAVQKCRYVWQMRRHTRRVYCRLCACLRM